MGWRAAALVAYDPIHAPLTAAPISGNDMDPLDAPETARKRAATNWLDLIVGGSAILIAVISLVVALRQSQIMERQLAASVWPYLQYQTSNATEDGKQVISFGVENVGVGPARVHSISMRIGDKPIRNVSELWTACCADLVTAHGDPAWRISSLHNQVLAPNRPKTFLLLTNASSNLPYWQRLNTEQSKIQIKVCYCSVLDECWLLDSSKDDRAPVAACPAPQADDYVD
jgi:hypothetical protein